MRCAVSVKYTLHFKDLIGKNVKYRIFFCIDHMLRWYFAQIIVQTDVSNCAKYVIKICYLIVSFYLLNVATGKFKIIYVVCIVCLLDISV